MSYKEQIQRVEAKYLESGGKWPASPLTWRNGVWLADFCKCTLGPLFVIMQSKSLKCGATNT